jgi:hypothetical protein
MYVTSFCGYRLKPSRLLKVILSKCGRITPEGLKFMSGSRSFASQRSRDNTLTGLCPSGAPILEMDCMHLLRRTADRMVHADHV